MAWIPQFGTSGIRGTVPEELTPGLAWRIGLSTATVFKQQALLLCHDNRTSSPLIARAVASGLMAGGSEVLWGGEVITPAVSFYTRHRNLEGAVLVTGSHIPPHMSGIEVLASDGSPVRPDIERKIERFILNQPKVKAWDHHGSTTHITDVGQFWVNQVIKQVNKEVIRKRHFHLTVDTANGSAIPWLFDVLSKLGCTLERINDEPSPFFPGRGPNLTVKILKQTAQIVQKTGSDLGVAVDGDGDRAFFIDEQGRTLMGDVSGTILARRELEQRGGGTIVTPINASNLVEDEVRKYGGKLIKSRVGPPAIVAAVKRHHAIFAFEESGKVIYPHLNYLSDSGLAAAHLLELLAEEKKQLSNIVDALPKYYQLKQAIDCPNHLKTSVTSYILESIKENFPQATVVTLDGVKVVFPDGWILFRPSGTEPVFRCFAEAQQESRTRELFNIGLNWIGEAIDYHQKTNLA